LLGQPSTIFPSGGSRFRRSGVRLPWHFVRRGRDRLVVDRADAIAKSLAAGHRVLRTADESKPFFRAASI
jgi:hypothetical protein